MRNFFSLPNALTLNPGVVKHFKRNFLANVMDMAFFMLGHSFFAAYTIMPVFISTLTDSPILIGIIPALEGAGWFLPQLFFANYLADKNRRLPIVLKLGIFDRIPIILLAVGALFIPSLDKAFAVSLFLFIYGARTILSGLVALPWQELIATVIPVSHRGRYWGSALILGSLMGMAGTALSGYLLNNVDYPLNYAIMFTFGFVFIAISYLFLRMNIEPEIERASSLKDKDQNLWRKIRNILKSDRNFLHFLINRGFVFLSFMVMGFITVYGIQQFNLSLSYSALFTFLMLFAEMFGYGIWGLMGDKMGYKRVLEFSSLFMILGLVILLFVKSIWVFYIVFGFISLAHAGEYVADQNIAMEFSTEVDRPTYIGMSKTLTGPFFLVAPIIGGALVKLWGYQSMFLVALVFSVFAFGTVKFFVREPRRQSDLNISSSVH